MQELHMGQTKKRKGGEMKRIQIIFERMPMSEKTFLKRWKAGKYPDLSFHNQNHPCEYIVKDFLTLEIIGMIKYYRGRLLSCYSVKQ